MGLQGAIRSDPLPRAARLPGNTLRQREAWTILVGVPGMEPSGRRMRAARAALALSLTAGLAMVPGCSSDSDTRGGCSDGLSVALDWQRQIPGAYVLTVDADGSTYTCDLGRLWDSGGGGSTGARVAPSIGGAPAVGGAAGAGGTAMSAGASGVAGAAGSDASAAGTAGLSSVDSDGEAESCSARMVGTAVLYMAWWGISFLGEHPSLVVVTLTRDGATVVDVTLEPAYEVCGSGVPRARWAGEEIAVP